MKKQLIISFVSTLLMFSHELPAAPNHESDLEVILQKGGFSPEVPLEAAVIKRYGAGHALAKDGVLHRTYYSKSQRLWVRLSADTDLVPRERVVSEVLISSIRPAQRAGSIKLKSDASKLRGIAIGDDASSLKMLGDAVELSAAIGGENVTVQRFRPDSADPNFYIDYYIRLGKVVAFAIGLDE